MLLNKFKEINSINNMILFIYDINYQNFPKTNLVIKIQVM